MHQSIYVKLFYLLISGFVIKSTTAMIMDTRNATYTFRMRVFDNELSDRPWAFPHLVHITKRIYVEVQLRPINDGIIDEDLVALPKNCFFSPNSNPAVDTRHAILIEGCPARKINDLRHYKRNKASSADHAIRFSLLIDDYFFPAHNFMFFHCSASVCAQNATKVVGIVEACPVDGGFCSSDGSFGDSTTSRDGSLAPRDQPAHYVNVFSGPMRPVYPPAEGQPVDDPEPLPPWTIKGDKLRLPSDDAASGRAPPSPSNHRNDCPPCVSRPSYGGDAAGVGGGDPAATPVVVVDGGLDTMTVFCIAAGSFTVGVLLMVGLCYVHRITDPKRLNASKSQRYSPTAQPRASLLPLNNTSVVAAFEADSSTSTVRTPNRHLTSPNGTPSASFSCTVASSALLLAAAKPKLRLPCCFDGSSSNGMKATTNQTATHSRPAHERPMLSVSDDVDDRYRLAADTQ